MLPNTVKDHWNQGRQMGIACPLETERISEKWIPEAAQQRAGEPPDRPPLQSVDWEHM